MFLGTICLENYLFTWYIIRYIYLALSHAFHMDYVRLVWHLDVIGGDSFLGILRIVV